MGRTEMGRTGQKLTELGRTGQLKIGQCNAGQGSAVQCSAVNEMDSAGSVVLCSVV